MPSCQSGSASLWSPCCHNDRRKSWTRRVPGAAPEMVDRLVRGRGHTELPATRRTPSGRCEIDHRGQFRHLERAKDGSHSASQRRGAHRPPPAHAAHGGATDEGKVVRIDLATLAIHQAKDVDENPGVAAQFGIRSIPTLMIFKNGKVEATQIGAVSKTQLTQLIDRTI